jgi:hypothetical protein
MGTTAPCSLETNWEKMKAGQPLESIEPLSEEKP